MGRIINDAAEFGLMLPKSQAVLYENLREFWVATPPESPEVAQADPDQPPEIWGVCGLSIIWANLAEVVSLAVSPKQRGMGLGRQLVEACLSEARALGIRKVMSLTYEKAFFARLGFAIVDRQELPLKVWADCVRCPKNAACDEIAMLRVLEDVPEPAGVAAPALTSPGRFGVPVVITTTAAGRDGRPLVGD